MKKTIPFIIISILLLFGASCWILNEKKSEDLAREEQTGVSMNEDERVSYDISLEEVKKAEIEDSFFVTGKIIFDQDAKSQVVPPLTGIVEKIFVKRGEFVKKGDLLASILSKDAAAYRMEYQQALNHSEMQKNIFESDLLLYQKGFISEHQWLKTKLDYDSSILALKFSKDRMVLMGLMDSPEEDPLQRYYLKAPLDGTMIENELILGAIVDSSTSFLTIADLKKLHIEMALNQDEAKTVQIGTEVELASTKGVVVSILPSIDQKTLKTYALASIEDCCHLTAGSLEQIKVITNREWVSLAVRKCSVIDGDGCKVVFMKSEAGFTPMEVEIGREDGNYIEIRGQLREGDIIASENLFVLKSELTKETEE